MRRLRATFHPRLNIFVVVFFHFACLCGMSYASAIEVTLLVHPFTITDSIQLGEESEKITLTARVNVEGVQFSWNLEGPGRLEGDTHSRQIVYVPPDALETASAEATIMVTVSDGKGEEITRKKTFTLAPAPCPTQLPPDVLKEITNLLITADLYFQRTLYTEPPGKNAFDLYQQVLTLDPCNSLARERICTMAEDYRKWGEIAKNRADESKAATYHQRYLLLSGYIALNFAEAITTPIPTTPVPHVVPTITTTSTPIPTPTSVPTPVPTPTTSPTPLPTSTPTDIPTPKPLPTSTPMPLPTSTPTPMPTPAPLPTLTPTSIPTATPTVSPIGQKLRAADTYVSQKKLTTPPGENAFELYQAVLTEEPANPHAKKKILEIADTYKKWADTAYTQKRTDKAQTYYERYVFVAQYISETFREERIIKELPGVRQRLNSLMATPTPEGDSGTTWTPTPTPEPEAEFRITKTVVRDEDGHPVKFVDGSYQVKVGKPIVIMVSFTNPHNHEIGIVWTAGRGKVLPIQNETNMYTATIEGADYIMVIVWDKETGDEISYPITIMAVE